MKRPKNDSSDRKEFNRQWRSAASNGEAPLLEPLTDGQGNAHNQTVMWRDPSGTLHSIDSPGFYTDPRDDNAVPGFVKTSMDASHATDDGTGRNVLTIEDSSANRRRGAIEKAGIREDVPSVLINGQPMAKDTANNLETHGVLPSGTVESAPSTQGWARETNNNRRIIMPSMSNDQKQQQEAPGQAPAVGSTGEPPPPPDKSSFPEESRQIANEASKQEIEQYQKELQERQAAMTADVEKERGGAQNQQPAHEQTQSKDDGTKNR